jgi:glycosyltransferase involved in cell wall biosynthesis
LIVADNARSRALRAAKGLARREGGPTPFPAGAGRRHVQPLRWRRDDAKSLRATRRWVAAYESTLRDAARGLGMVRPAIVVSHPLVAGFARFDWAGPVTYFAIDDWRAHPGKQPWWKLFDQAHAALRDTGRRVCAVSEAIVTEIAPSGPAIVVPNGIEPREWRRPGAPPAWMAEAPGPRLIYTGSLDTRLDTAWLAAVCAALPGASVHLVGPLLDAAHLAPLNDTPNLAIHPPMDRAGIVAAVAGADVGLLPHVRTPLTDGMSPLKLYEYLAAGLPVAATDLQPVRGVDPRVALAAPGGDFVGAVRSAIALGRASEPERRSFLAANSWSRRHDQTLDFVLGS